MRGKSRDQGECMDKRGNLKLNKKFMYLSNKLG